MLAVLQHDLQQDPSDPAHSAGSFPAVGTNPLRRLSNCEVINALNDLFPSVHPVLPTLPLDTVVAGFENAIESQTPSDVRIARYEEIANRYALELTASPERIAQLTGCSSWSTPSSANDCATNFISDIGRRVFRRPLTLEEQGRFVANFQSFAVSIDFEAAVQLTLCTMLQSPQFLYRAEPANESDGGTSLVSSFTMASRLSFFLWESVPDELLLEAAERDELRTRAQISAQAIRMLDDAKSSRALWGFVRQWLALDRIQSPEHASRADEVDAAWTANTQNAAYEETRLFVEHVLREEGTLAALFTSRRAWLNAELARVYGVAPPCSAWVESSLPREQRAGILTRVAFLAGYAHRGGVSPPIRGNFVLTKLLGEPPTSPPADADLSRPIADPALGPKTNRMLFEARTQSRSCQGCHERLNGFGFGFENYGASGVYHTQDQSLPVDATGSIHGTDVDRKYAGAIELSEILAQSETLQRCVVRQWYRYAFGRAHEAGEEATVASLQQHFIASHGNIRELLLAIVISPSFRSQKAQSQ